MSDAFGPLVNQLVVLDTGGTTLYIGRLMSQHPEGFWLEGADVHHVDEGHASREQYIVEAARDGIRVNRQRVFVLRSSVISISALSDVVTD